MLIRHNHMFLKGHCVRVRLWMRVLFLLLILLLLLNLLKIVTFTATFFHNWNKLQQELGNLTICNLANSRLGTWELKPGQDIFIHYSWDIVSDEFGDIVVNESWIIVTTRAWILKTVGTQSLTTVGILSYTKVGT